MAAALFSKDTSLQKAFNHTAQAGPPPAPVDMREGYARRANHGRRAYQHLREITPYPWQADEMYGDEIEKALLLMEENIKDAHEHTFEQHTLVGLQTKDAVKALRTTGLEPDRLAVAEAALMEQCDTLNHKAWQAEQDRVAALEDEFIHQQKEIENRYKSAYLRENPGYDPVRHDRKPSTMPRP